jgi:hypothetical protein
MMIIAVGVVVITILSAVVLRSLLWVPHHSGSKNDLSVLYKTFREHKKALEDPLVVRIPKLYIPEPALKNYHLMMCNFYKTLIDENYGISLSLDSDLDKVGINQ